MNIHKNARLTPIGRERLVRMVEGGQSRQAEFQIMLLEIGEMTLSS